MKGMDLLRMPDAALEQLGSILEVITAKHLLPVPSAVVEELACVLDEIAAKLFAALAILSADARGAIELTISGHLIHDFKGLLNEADDIVTMSALPPQFGLPRLLEYAHRLDTKYATMSEYKTRSLVITVLRQASVLKENLPTFRELLNLYSYRTYMGRSPHTQVQPKDVVLDIFLGADVGNSAIAAEYLGREYSYSGLTFLTSGKSTAVREADTDVYAVTDTNGMLMIFTVYFCFLSGIALNMLPQSRGQVSVVFRGLPFPAVFQSSFVLAISLALSAACGALIVRGSSTFYAYLAALSMAAAAFLLLCSFSSLLYFLLL